MTMQMREWLARWFELTAKQVYADNAQVLWTACWSSDVETVGWLLGVYGFPPTHDSAARQALAKSLFVAACGSSNPQADRVIWFLCRDNASWSSTFRANLDPGFQRAWQSGNKPLIDWMSKEYRSHPNWTEADELCRYLMWHKASPDELKKQTVVPKYMSEYLGADKCQAVLNVLHHSLPRSIQEETSFQIVHYAGWFVSMCMRTRGKSICKLLCMHSCLSHEIAITT